MKSLKERLDEKLLSDPAVVAIINQSFPFAVRNSSDAPFMQGYADWAVKGENLNPYADGTKEWGEYDDGYREGQIDDDYRRVNKAEPL